MGALARTAAALALVLLPSFPVGAQLAGNRLSQPIWVYNDWSAYDELSDEAPLTEALAMRELQELLRLRRAGVGFDYYVMDAFWYDPDGGYRRWRKESWPDGPDAWLAACRDNGIKPGLWFSTNSLTHMNPAAKWRQSLTADGTAMALYAGGFLGDFIDVLQHWHDRGVRLFKLDFADFDAAAPGDEQVLAPLEIHRRNRNALREALLAFRRRNPDAVLVAFNGYVGDVGSAKSEVRASVLRWLDVFDALYAGDPRPANVPEMNFWRSVDIYSDRMVRRFEQAGVPLNRIDSTGFMIGDTGTIYGRRTAGWRGMLLLMMARGGWVNTVHGNLEFLDDADARWFAQAQSLYRRLQRDGATRAFGGLAGDREPYGFAATMPGGSLYTVVNPAQRVQTAALPAAPQGRAEHAPGRILFRDPGFAPVLLDRSVRLGPGQLAVVGYGDYADPANDLGIGADIRIPLGIKKLPAHFARTGREIVFAATVQPPANGDLRIIMRQKDSGGATMRSISRTSMADFFTIRATQGGRQLPVLIDYDKIIWSGLAWAAGEIRRRDIAPDQPVEIRLSSADPDLSLSLEGEVYRVDY